MIEFKTRDSRLAVLTCIFAAALISANILAVKLTSVAGLVFPTGTLAFLVAFLVTDIVTEVWGPKSARELIIGGFVSNIIIVGMIHLAISMPPAGFWEYQDQFANILSGSSRIVIAGLVTYLVSKNLNVWVFDKIRHKTEGKHLWLRNNVSSLIAQLVDTAMFITLAFVGTFDIGYIGGMIFATFIVKIVLDICKTPLVYLGVWWSRKT